MAKSGGRKPPIYQITWPQFITAIRVEGGVFVVEEDGMRFFRRVDPITKEVYEQRLPYPSNLNEPVGLIAPPHHLPKATPRSQGVFSGLGSWLYVLGFLNDDRLDRLAWQLEYVGAHFGAATQCVAGERAGNPVTKRGSDGALVPARRDWHAAPGSC